MIFPAIKFRVNFFVHRETLKGNHKTSYEAYTFSDINNACGITFLIYLHHTCVYSTVGALSAFSQSHILCVSEEVIQSLLKHCWRWHATQRKPAANNRAKEMRRRMEKAGKLLIFCFCYD